MFNFIQTVKSLFTSAKPQEKNDKEEAALQAKTTEQNSRPVEPLGFYLSLTK